MKRALKYILRTLLALVLLVVMLVASLYLPPVQRWAVNRLTAYIEKQTGLQVSIGSVHLSPLLDLKLGQVRVAQPPTDLLNVDGALVDLDLTRLLSGHVGVEAIELSKGSINTTDWIESLQMDGSISLHAWRLWLEHPVSHTPITIEAPVPDDRLWKEIKKPLMC